MLQCDWARDGQCETLNQVQFESQSIRYAKFYLSEYLDTAGLTATVLRSKRTGEHLKKLNVLHCDPSSLYEVESCCSFISSY